MSSTTAASACISPSIVMSGRRPFTISTARLTFSDSGCLADPKLENESIATRGLIDSRRTKSAVRMAVLVLAMMLVAGVACTTTPEAESTTTTTLGGAASPEEALTALFDAVVHDQYQDTATLTFDDQLALLAVRAA